MLENVKGLANHDKGRTLDIMIETLNEIGYTVDFEILNSKYFGVPQNRERIFIVAIRDDLIEQEKWSEETMKGQTVVPRCKRRLVKYEWLKSFNFDWPAQEEVTTRLRDILENDVDEKYYLDDEKTVKLVAQLNEYNDVDEDFSEHARLGHVDITEEQVPKWIPKPNEINRTLRSGGKSSLTDKHSYDHVAEENRPSRYRIRKLTPLECFRLQGFSDEAHEAVKQAGISDSQRYKQAGNAVTVNVIEAIAERLIPLITD